MRKFSKNKKGATLAEEIIVILLLTILISAATGIIMNQMRVFAHNALTLSAQQRGTAIMDELVDDLQYAVIIKDTDFTEDDDTTGLSSLEQLSMAEENDGNILQKVSDLKFSESEGNAVTLTNAACELGNYDATFELAYDPSAQTMQVTVTVSRSGSTYYRSSRNITLKNAGVDGFSVSLTNDAFDSSSGAILYVAALE